MTEPKVGAFTYLECIMRLGSGLIEAGYAASTGNSPQADDAVALVLTMERHARRKRMEREYGPINVGRTDNPTPNHAWDYEAAFDRYYDMWMPSWATGLGATEAEALDELLTQAEEHYRAECDEKIQADLERRAGC